jgi:hypothetical protein
MGADEDGGHKRLPIGTRMILFLLPRRRSLRPLSPRLLTSSRSSDDTRLGYRRLRVAGEMNFAPTSWVEAHPGGKQCGWGAFEDGVGTVYIQQKRGAEAPLFCCMLRM